MSVKLPLVPIDDNLLGVARWGVLLVWVGGLMCIFLFFWGERVVGFSQRRASHELSPILVP